jgi:hypothetical protein
MVTRERFCLLKRGIKRMTELAKKGFVPCAMAMPTRERC